MGINDKILIISSFKTFNGSSNGLTVYLSNFCIPSSPKSLEFLSLLALDFLAFNNTSFVSIRNFNA